MSRYVLPQAHLLSLLIPPPYRSRPNIVAIIVLGSWRCHILSESDVDSALDRRRSDSIRRTFWNGVKPVGLCLPAIRSVFSYDTCGSRVYMQAYRMSINVPPVRLNFIGLSSSPFFPFPSCPFPSAFLIGLCFNRKSLAPKKLKLAIAGSFSRKCSSSE
jgi:hypothetical protein